MIVQVHEKETLSARECVLRNYRTRSRMFTGKKPRQTPKHNNLWIPLSPPAAGPLVYSRPRTLPGSAGDRCAPATELLRHGRRITRSTFCPPVSTAAPDRKRVSLRPVWAAPSCSSSVFGLVPPAFLPLSLGPCSRALPHACTPPSTIRPPPSTTHHPSTAGPW